MAVKFKEVLSAHTCIYGILQISSIILDNTSLSQLSATYHTKGRVFPTFNCMGNDLTPLGSFLMTHMFSLGKGKLCYCNVSISSRKLAESSVGVRRAYRINRYTSNKIVIVFCYFRHTFSKCLLCERYLIRLSYSTGYWISTCSQNKEKIFC
jgi:hypothetical protein